MKNIIALANVSASLNNRYHELVTAYDALALEFSTKNCEYSRQEEEQMKAIDAWRDHALAKAAQNEDKRKAEIEKLRIEAEYPTKLTQQMVAWSEFNKKNDAYQKKHLEKAAKPVYDHVQSPELKHYVQELQRLTQGSASLFPLVKVQRYIVKAPSSKDLQRKPYPALPMGKADLQAYLDPRDCSVLVLTGDPKKPGGPEYTLGRSILSRMENHGGLLRHCDLHFPENPSPAACASLKAQLQKASGTGGCFLFVTTDAGLAQLRNMAGSAGNIDLYHIDCAKQTCSLGDFSSILIAE